MELFKDKTGCCGCKACYKVCPEKAIELEMDLKGFTYPIIDNKKCIGCEKCKKVCPIKGDLLDIKDQEIYAIKNKDDNIREKSTSGGFFDAISQYVLKEKGYVYGVIFDKELKAVNYGTNNNEEIELFKKSKYVQSDIKNTYVEVEKLLLDNKLVLYSGTPCQIFGLRKFLKNKNFDNLITVDNVCHGVPSPKIFEEHKKYLSKKYKSDILHMEFRYKNKKKDKRVRLKVRLANGNEYVRTAWEDEYYSLFLSDYILRDSCYNCKFANTNRVSDITMGDFWDYNDFLKDFNDGKGVSLIILNTDKGKKLFNILKNYFDIKNSTLEQCMQPNLKRPTPRPENYDEFCKLYENKGYEYVIKKFPKTKFKSKIKRSIRKIFEALHIYKEK